MSPLLNSATSAEPTVESTPSTSSPPSPSAEVHSPGSHSPESRAADGDVGGLPPRFDRLYRYGELWDLLRRYGTAYPHLVTVDTLGRSYEGREIPLVRVTAPLGEGQGDRDRPALWIDGNIHATELAASTAVLYFLDALVRGYGSDPEITRALDGCTFYLCPRINPDGAELALADSPRFVRSSTRPYPGDRVAGSDFEVMDLDGDGRIRQMRVPDPNGAWKVCEADPRLMVRREPTELGGTYYRLLPEGQVRNYDGVTVAMPGPEAGLDLNRNFPAQWRPEGEQQGSGPFPASEPEVRAIVDFFDRHPNIATAVSFHTFGRMLLRPYSHAADTDLPPEDWQLFKAIGDRGTALTGYPAFSVYEGYLDHPQHVMTGAFDDWAYEARGILAWTVELWNLPEAAGVKVERLLNWLDEHPVEEDLQILHWADEHLCGSSSGAGNGTGNGEGGDRGYGPWRPFEHPQLGPVELGGWDSLYTWRNPPADLLEAEVARFPRWLIWQALLLPKLDAIAPPQIDPLGPNTYRLTWTVQNTGWLPTATTRRALDQRLVRPCIARIDLPPEATLLTGQPEQEVGHLKGRSHQPSAPYYDHDDATDDRVRLVWLISAPAGTTVTLTVRGDRAGQVQTQVTLPS